MAYNEGIEFEKGNKLKEALRYFARAIELNPGNKDYQAAQERVMAQRKSKLEGFDLNLKSSKPITLKFKDAKLKDVFNIVTQLSGINFVFDDAVKDQPVTIYLENATFQQTLDLLTNLFKLGRKIANESTVVIYPKTPEKIKQYEEMQLRTFHLNYMDAKKAINLLRGMFQIRKIYVNEESNSIVVRDTSDVVDVVDKILEASDMPDPEVVLDIEVIEVSDSNAEQLGLLLSQYSVQLGAYSPAGTLMADSLSSATTTSSTTSTTVTTSADISNLLQAFKMRGYGGFVTVPNAQYNLGKTLAKGEVLSNPKIRIKNREKSKFTVGTRVPITTTSTTGTTGGFSVNVQYVDVGVKVNAEPNIQLNNEIVIKISLEVSSILSRDTVGGTSSATVVATIGTRNLETVLSLKDGETSVIGGLISNSKSESKKKLFLIGDIPFLGPLLSSNNTSKDKTELLLAITPRLVRGLSIPQKSLTSFASGKEDEPSLKRPLASFDLEPVFKGNARAPEQRPVAPALIPVPAVNSKPVIPQTAVTLSTADTTAPPVQASTQPAAADQPQRALLRISAPPSSIIGQQFKLDIKVSDIKDVFEAPFVLSYDPVLVEFISASEGSFLKGDNKQVAFSSKVDMGSGTVTVSLARGTGSGGISGSGDLMSLVFLAKAQGSAGFGFNSTTFSTDSGQPVTVLPFSTAVEIRQP